MPQLNFQLRRLKGIALFLIALSLTISLLFTINFNQISLYQDTIQTSSTTAPSNWTNVAIGGGGYVTGIYFHPKQSNLIYLKTDIGGFYRWNPGSSAWVSISDRFSLRENNYYGGEALAVDPQDPNTVYIAAGKYTADWWTELGAIFKSTDQGQTWTKLSLELLMGGNEDKRWAGERLAVDPFDSRIILFGSRRDGLWRSADAGKTWRAIEDFPGQLDGKIGINTIVFDYNSPGRLYAAVYEDGVYRSTDAGVTWNKLPESPTEVNRISISSNGILYLTHTAGVHKYENARWYEITPESITAVFNALSINPNNPNDVLVASGETVKTKLYRSLNGGSTWIEQRRLSNSTVPWWSDFMRANPWISSVAFDPRDPQRVWLTDWYGIWHSVNIDVNPAIWTNLQKGHEELVVFSLISPPKGTPLLSGVADVDGFSHNNGLTLYPSQTLGPGDPGYPFQDTYSIAYCERYPQFMARVGGNREQGTYGGAISQDGGSTWIQFPTWISKTAMPLRVAMSATNSKRLVVTISGAQAVQTNNGGISWRDVVGLPRSPTGPWYWQQPLAADPVLGENFYYYDKGKAYRSHNGGLSFQIVNSHLPSEDWATLKTVPDKASEVWLSLNRKGLYRSVDGGATFSQIQTVERAYLFAIGKPPAHQITPALYLYGEIAGKGEGIFVTLDDGSTWTTISNPKLPIGNSPSVMEASKQQYGLVFVGTNGRGIYYKALPPP